MSIIQRLLNDRQGVTAIEYGMIAGIMAVIVIAAFALFGDAFTTAFTAITGAMTGGGGGE